MRPARQGTFDGLCGVYAIINALDPAGLVLRRSQLHADLFKQLTYGLGSVAVLAGMQEGIERDDLIRAAQPAFRWLELEHGISLSIHAPYPKRRFQSSREFLDTLKGHMASKNEAAIISVITPTWGHWTVPTAITGGCLVLRDSGGLGSIPLAKLLSPHYGWLLAASDTLLIRRGSRSVE